QHLGISSEFANTLGFQTGVTIRSVGILKNPLHANGSPYTSQSFNQCVDLAITPTNLSIFEEGEEIRGNTSDARGQVAKCNTSICTITGYSGTFIPGELLVGQSSGVGMTLNSLNTSADLKL